MEVHYGDIWYIRTYDTHGHLQSGIRPWVIVSNDIGNVHSPLVNAVPLTTNLYKKPLPTHCDIISAPERSIALCEQVKPIEKIDLIEKVGECKNFEMRQISICIMIQFNIL